MTIPRSRRCDANLLLAAALELVRPAIDRSGAQVTHDALPGLYCDPTQISQTFANLIDNSIKFRGESRPEIHVSAQADGDAWIYSFRDNGMGIDPRHSERIFGVFKRIHNDGYPGAGVGLAIAKKIVEGHGGRIWVESALGRYFKEIAIASGFQFNVSENRVLWHPAQFILLFPGYIRPQNSLSPLMSCSVSDRGVVVTRVSPDWDLLANEGIKTEKLNRNTVR